ncbi:MAG: glycosyltransferase family 2 protein [Bacteroidetes bacterium]|nr:glycosyltransferase family 2 protein [Bacteroidota bacterium]
MNEHISQSTIPDVTFEPLVSIVITSFNRAHYIEEAIRSALAQDYRNLEIIISDNCSTDGSSEIFKKYSADKRLKIFVNESNIGMIPNFKLGTERAAGEYITYLSSDDYFVDNTFISKAITAIQKNRKVVIVFSKFEIFYESTNTIVVEKQNNYVENDYLDGKTTFLKFAKVKGLGWGGTLMEKEKLIAANVFEKPINSLDYEANLTLLLLGDAYFIGNPTYLLRMHPNQASQTINAKKLIENFKYFLKTYQYALSIHALPKDILDNWKNDLLLMEARSLDYLPDRKEEHQYLMNYFKQNHPDVYKKLKANIKWRVLKVLHSNRMTQKLFYSLYKFKFQSNKKE